MPGFTSITGDESIVYADNASFNGTERGGKMTTDGQLWIGSTASPHVRLGTLTAGSGVTITNSAGGITIAASATGTVQTLTGNTGGAISPVAGNINVIGTGSISLDGSGNTISVNLTGLTNHAILAGSGTSTITNLGPLTNGQLLIGNTGNNATAAALTAGTGISITNGAGSITVNAAGGGLTWSVITGASQAMAVNNGYIANRAGTVAFTLPTTSAVGDMVAVTGINTALGWSIAYTTNQQIFFGASTATLTTGSLASTATRDTVFLVCVVQDLTWNVVNSIGNITIA